MQLLLRLHCSTLWEELCFCRDTPKEWSHSKHPQFLIRKFRVPPHMLRLTLIFRCRQDLRKLIYNTCAEVLSRSTDLELTLSPSSQRETWSHNSLDTIRSVRITLRNISARCSNNSWVVLSARTFQNLRKSQKRGYLKSCKTRRMIWISFRWNMHRLPSIRLPLAHI